MKQGRLDIRLPAELVDRIKAVARKRGTTVTAMVEEHFKKVLEEDFLAEREEVEQI